ncbi:MAG: AMIN-like domain-containing (lipo)protein [Phycicoccus sp.]
MTTRPPATRTRRAAAGMLAAAALLVVPAAADATTAPAASSCSTAWGSLAEIGDDSDVGGDIYPKVDGLRAGRHACYDRLVFDVDKLVPGYDVRYVSTVTQDGSGDPVPVAGGARLAIKLGARYPGTSELPSVSGYRTFREVKSAGSVVDGQTTFALGVRARLPFRVWSTYDEDAVRSKIVIDVAHSW